MTGIQFVTDEKSRNVGVLIDLKKHGAIWEDLRDGLISESRRKEKGHSFRAIPRQPPETRPPAWLGILSKFAPHLETRRGGILRRLAVAVR